jgi:predicted transcriptional regulator
MKRIEIEVIDPKAEQAALLDWAARVDAGVAQRPATAKLRFASYRQLHATLTEKRMGLLEYVAANEATSIRQLAGQLARDYRNVYDDVQRLAQLGLIEIQPGKLHVPYDQIDIRKTLREAA